MADLHDRDAVSDLDPADQIDFSLVHADDAFLDALGAAEPDPTGEFADDRLAELLLSWRRDVDAEPITDLVEPKLAVDTVQAARIRQRRSSRMLAPVAAAAAVLAIVFAGVGLAAREAQPGDTLWGLTRVLYADHARSVEAAAAVRTDLREAEEALAIGKVAEAKVILDEARHVLPTVSTEDGQADLRAQHAALVAKLPDNPAVDPSPPPAASPTTVPGNETSSVPSSSPQGSVTVAPSTTPNVSTLPTAPSPSVSPSEAPGRIETTPNAPNGPNGTPDSGPNTQPDGGQPADAPADKPASTEP